MFLSPVPRPVPRLFFFKKAGAPFPDPRFLKHLPRTTLVEGGVILGRARRLGWVVRTPH